MFTENQNKVKPVQQDISEPLDNATDAAEQAAAGAKAFAGYLLISRCLIDHDVVGFGRPGKPADPKRGCYSHSEAWQYLLMQASFKARITKVDKTIYNLARGELVVAERFLAQKWNWTYKAVRVFLLKLRAQSMLKKGAFKGRKIPIITICNYDKYQVAGDVKGAVKEGVGAQSTLEKGDKKKECSRKNVVVKKDSSKDYRPSHPTEDRAVTKEPVQLDILAGPADEAMPPPAPPAAPPGQTKPDAKARKAEAVTKAFEVWAKLAAEYKFPACKSVSAKRRSSMGERLEQVGGDVQEFENILRREIAASEFLRGKIKPRPGSGYRQFELSIDFVLQPSSWDKFIDGHYSRKAGGPRSTQRIDIDQLQADAAKSIALTKEIAAQARKSALDRITQSRKG